MGHVRESMLAACVLGCVAAGAIAGRPLSTDDAGVAERGKCQLESWLERAQSDGATVFAPACGVASGSEAGLTIVLPRARDVVRTEAGIALKLAPDAWRHATPAGELALGLKAEVAFEQHARTDAWRHTSAGLSALVSWAPAPAWTLHLNLGTALHRPAHASSSMAKAALLWTPSVQWATFGEVQWSSRPEVFGDAVRTLGARYWLQPEVLGVDLTASRQNSAGATLWTFGVGWYGWSL